MASSGVRGFRVRSDKSPVEKWAETPSFERMFRFAGEHHRQEEPGERNRQREDEREIKPGIPLPPRDRVDRARPTELLEPEKKEGRRREQGHDPIRLP